MKIYKWDKWINKVANEDRWTDTIADGNGWIDKVADKKPHFFKGTVKFVGLNFKSFMFSYGQFYIVVSRVALVSNLKMMLHRDAAKQA
jgi:hypothetical protein